MFSFYPFLYILIFRNFAPVKLRKECNSLEMSVG